MLFGLPPFYHDNIQRMFEMIKTGELRFPKKIQVSDCAKDLVQKVL